MVPPTEAGRPKSVQKWTPGAVYDCYLGPGGPKRKLHVKALGTEGLQQLRLQPSEDIRKTKSANGSPGRVLVRSQQVRRPSRTSNHEAACLGGPLAETQPFEKFFSKPNFGSPNGLFPPENPSIEASTDGFPRGRPIGLQNSGFEKNFSKGWVPAKSPPLGLSRL